MKSISSEQELSNIIEQDVWMMDVLRTAEKSQLNDWWIGVGFLRNKAWDYDPRGIMAARSGGLYVCAITTRFSKDELMALEFPPHVAADSYSESSNLFNLNGYNETI